MASGLAATGHAVKPAVWRFFTVGGWIHSAGKRRLKFAVPKRERE
jgi:hypothetical protein